MFFTVNNISKGGRYITANNMSTIQVEIERLIQSSKQIDDKNDYFKKLTNDLYTRIDHLQTVWSGKDNLAFTNKIKDFQNFIHSLSLVLTQYSDFLRNSAHAYGQTQDELYSEVMRMKS